MNAKTKREKGHQRKNSEKIEIACVCRPVIWLGKVRKTSYGLPCTEDDSFIIATQQTCCGALSTRVRPTVVSNASNAEVDWGLELSGGIAPKLSRHPALHLMGFVRCSKVAQNQFGKALEVICKAISA